MANSMMNGVRNSVTTIMRSMPNIRGRGRFALAFDRMLLGGGADPIFKAPMLLGHSLFVDMRVQSHVWAAYSGTYNDIQIKSLMRLFPVGGVAMDVGANIGFYTVPLARAAKEKGGRVLAFEPYLPNADRLRSNLEINNLTSQVDIHNVALSDDNGSAILELREDFASGGETGNAVIALKKPGDRMFREITIKLVKLDDIWPSLGLERLDIIKADIEGHEDAFMRGAAQTLGKFRPIIQLEINRGHYEPSGIEIGAAFKAALPPNYRFFVLDEAGRFAPLADLSEYFGDEDAFAVPLEKSLT